ncbi:MAG: type II toxin-antitoxin system RatA family toxin [Rhodospirillales bacterium]|nr:type II toxin-antitoxin system RatA family toxin [Rhodospirillales bacterium]
MPTHGERRTLPYTREQMFDLVADVERYPEFLPWCLACRIRRKITPDLFVADLMIGFKMFRERFASEVTLSRPGRVDVVYREGPFRHLTNHWNFTEDERGRCVIDFYIDFEFRSKTLQKVIGKLFNEAVQRMVNAFEKRATQLYGPGQVGEDPPAEPTVSPEASPPGTVPPGA